MKIFKKMLAVFLILILALLAFWLDLEGVFLSDLKQTQARIAVSPNFKNGRAQNVERTALLIEPPESDDSADSQKTKKFSWLDMFVIANTQIPSVKSDLANLSDAFVWFGHSSYLLNLNGKNVLVDPVFNDNAAPVPWIINAFKGTEIYTAADMPSVDFLIITHNHYDHLSRKTLRALAGKVKTAIVPLGVGKYLKSAGLAESQITELDWNESADFSDDGDFKFHALTARHFSGRGLLDSNKTLWASFLIETGEKKIFVGGDSGYGTHFKEIGERFGTIDLAFLDNGQFDPRWPLIHAQPQETLQIATDLNTKRLMTVHNSKFQLAPHAWQLPLEKVFTLYHNGDFTFSLLTPKVGEIVPISDSADSAKFKTPWWRENPR